MWSPDYEWLASFLGDSIDRITLLKRFAALVLKPVRDTSAQPGLGAPAWLLRTA
jgi:hypothetical protein